MHFQSEVLFSSGFDKQQKTTQNSNLLMSIYEKECLPAVAQEHGDLQGKI